MENEREGGKGGMQMRSGGEEWDRVGWIKKKKEREKKRERVSERRGGRCGKAEEREEQAEEKTTERKEKRLSTREVRVKIQTDEDLFLHMVWTLRLFVASTFSVHGCRQQLVAILHQDNEGLICPFLQARINRVVLKTKYKMTCS